MKRERLCYLYNHLEEIILVTLFVLMVAVIFIQIIMRYVFNNSLSWSEELGRFVFEWLTWIGLSLGARVGQHIRISLLVDRLPSNAAQTANIISEIIVIIICGLTIYYGVELSKMFAGSRFTTIKISLAWGYASVVTGCGLMIVRSLGSIGKSITAIHNANRIIEGHQGGGE